MAQVIGVEIPKFGTLKFRFVKSIEDNTDDQWTKVEVCEGDIKEPTVTMEKTSSPVNLGGNVILSVASDNNFLLLTRGKITQPISPRITSVEHVNGWKVTNFGQENRPNVFWNEDEYRDQD